MAPHDTTALKSKSPRSFCRTAQEEECFLPPPHRTIARTVLVRGWWCGLHLRACMLCVFIVDSRQARSLAAAKAKRPARSHSESGSTRESSGNGRTFRQITARPAITLSTQFASHHPIDTVANTRQCHAQHSTIVTVPSTTTFLQVRPGEGRRFLEVGMFCSPTPTPRSRGTSHGV